MSDEFEEWLADRIDFQGKVTGPSVDEMKAAFTAGSEASYRKAFDEQQAKIDMLMLEHCPDEMTAEQIAEWQRNQTLSRHT